MYGFKGDGKLQLLSETTHLQHALRHCHASQQTLEPAGASISAMEDSSMTIDIAAIFKWQACT